jgi:hypothetical protein
MTVLDKHGPFRRAKKTRGHVRGKGNGECVDVLLLLSQQVAQMPTQQPMETPSKPADEQGMDWSSPQQQPTTAGGSGSGGGQERGQGSLSGGVSTGAPALPGAPPVPGDMDPEVTRTRLAEFLHRHTAYELIPESAKVVVLDTALPVQQVSCFSLHSSFLISLLAFQLGSRSEV